MKTIILAVLSALIGFAAGYDKGMEHYERLKALEYYEWYLPPDNKSLDEKFV